MIRVAGLGLIHILFAPHLIKESDRAESVMQMMKRTYKIPAVQLDNSALEVVDDTYRVLTTGENPVAEKCYGKNGEYIRKSIIFDEFRSLEELYEKN